MPNGVLLVYKPKGLTSHSVVNKVRFLLKEKRVGHSGTLDPLAEGLLVLLVGDATLLSRYLMEGDKKYRVGIYLGYVTDTGDTTGQVISDSGCVELSESVILKEMKKLDGVLEMEVPSYSAIKVKGRKLYEYVRAGLDVPKVYRKMTFWDIKYRGREWVEYKGVKRRQYNIRLCCKKGGYVRSWIHELGERLGVGATMSSLVRTESAPYHLSDALSLETLSALGYVDSKAWFPMDQLLNHVMSISVDGLWARLMENGQIPHRLKERLNVVHSNIRWVKIFRKSDNRWISLLEKSGKANGWRVACQFMTPMKEPLIHS